MRRGPYQDARSIRMSPGGCRGPRHQTRPEACEERMERWQVPGLVVSAEDGELGEAAVLREPAGSSPRTMCEVGVWTVGK